MPIAFGGIDVGHCSVRSSTSDSPKPRPMPSRPPNEADDDGLDEELQEDVLAARADGEPQADLAGALGDRDQHDVHDADAADEQRHAGDRRQQRRHRPRGFGADAGDLFLRADHEVVRLARRQLVPHPQRLAIAAATGAVSAVTAEIVMLLMC